MKIKENNWLNLKKSLKKILILIEIMYYLKDKKIFNELGEEKSYIFQDLKEKINPNNLIYTYKIERRSPKDFSNYQNIFIYKKVKLNLNQI